jgi:hypothetical protein
LVHKASFGDKLPQPGEKSYHWTPTDDVVFGACSLNDLKSSVEKKFYLPMTIYMVNVFAFSLRVIPKCFVCGKREKGIRHFSLIIP